jgi:hypothetical protein
LAISSVSAINLPDNEPKSGKSSIYRTAALRDEGKNLRKIAGALASEFNLKKLDATSVKRILDRA